MAATSTTLSAAIGAGDTEFPVASLTGFPARGTRQSQVTPLFAQIEDELLMVAGTSSGGNVLVRLRGAHGTLAAAHASGATISVSSAASDFPVAPYSLASGLLASMSGTQIATGASLSSTATGIGTAGPGSIFLLTGSSPGLRVNLGTAAAPRWVTGIANQGPLSVGGTIVSADLTGTSAGQFGHANGYPLVPQPGSSAALPYLFPIAVFLHYGFATAAYTGGGTTSLNFGGGGAATTGTVSAANFAAAGTSQHVVLLPVVPTNNALTFNQSLNLVTSAAFTQPGTAAGYILYQVLYSATG